MNKPTPDYAQTYALDFYTQVLGKLGAPVTENNIVALDAWARAEGSHAAFNPFDTTIGEPGSTYYNSFGPGGKYHVKNYTSEAQGITATVDTLLHSSPSYHYDKIVGALRTSDPSHGAHDVAAAIGASPWGTSRKAVVDQFNAALKDWHNWEGQVIPQGITGGAATGAAHVAVNVAKDAVNVIDSIPKFLGLITSGSFWIRAGFVILGFVLLVVGVRAVLGDEMPSKPDVPTPPATRPAKLAEEAA